MSEINAKECVDALRLEQGKLNWINDKIKEEHIDLLLTAMLDETYTRRHTWEPSKLYVLPDVHEDDIKHDGVLKNLWFEDFLTSNSGARIEINNHRVFLDSAGIRLYEQLHPLLPPRKGMEIRKFRTKLLIDEFYGLPAVSVRRLINAVVLHDTTKAQQKEANYWVIQSPSDREGLDELIEGGFVVEGELRIHLTPKGFMLRNAIKRCSFEDHDFPDNKPATFLSLFKANLPQKKDKSPLENPTDLNFKRDGLLLTASKLWYCWQHRNDPIDMSDWESPQLSQEVVDAQNKLIGLNSKIYEPDELEPIRTWTVEDQRKQNDDYWNAGPSVFWLNPAAYNVGPHELPNYAADPTPAPEWWTPRAPKLVKQDTYSRDIMAQAMEAPKGLEGPKGVSAWKNHDGSTNWDEVGKDLDSFYEDDFDDWLDPHSARQRDYVRDSEIHPKGTGLKLDDRSLKGYGIMVETKVGIIGFVDLESADRFMDVMKHFPEKELTLQKVSELADWARKRDYISPENHKLLEDAKKQAAKKGPSALEKLMLASEIAQDAKRKSKAEVDQKIKEVSKGDSVLRAFQDEFLALQQKQRDMDLIRRKHERPKQPPFKK